MLKIEKHRHWLALIVLFSVPLSGLNIDIISPSLPAISHYFQVNKSLAQLTVTAGIIGFAITVLFAGSLSDNIGRKKPFIITLLIYIMSSYFAAATHNIYQLLALRFLQGMMIGCFVIPLRAVLSDLYVDKQFFKMMTYLAMAWAIGPIIAPVIGGYLQYYFGWQANFYFLAVYATLLWLLNIIFVPETLRIKQQFTPQQMYSNYWHMMRNPDFLIGVASIGLMYSMILLFGLVGPFLIQNILHYSAVEFGHFALLMGIALFLGNITGRLLFAVSFSVKIISCYSLMIVTAFIMTVVTFWMPKNIYNIILPCFVLIYLAGIAYPLQYAHCLTLFPTMAGAANALALGLNIIVCGIVTVLAAFLKSNTELPFSLVYLVLSVLLISVVYLKSWIDCKNLKNIDNIKAI